MDIICSNVSCFTPNNRLNASSWASFCFFPGSMLYPIISEVVEQVHCFLYFPVFLSILNRMVSTGAFSPATRLCYNSRNPAFGYKPVPERNVPIIICIPF
jgi:hypothetical protein